MELEYMDNAKNDQLIGLRNRIVHDYGNVDLNIVFETLKFDIPDLLERLSSIEEIQTE